MLGWHKASDNDFGTLGPTFYFYCWAFSRVHFLFFLQNIEDNPSFKTPFTDPKDGPYSRPASNPIPAKHEEVTRLRALELFSYKNLLSELLSSYPYEVYQTLPKTKALSKGLFLQMQQGDYFLNYPAKLPFKKAFTPRKEREKADPLWEWINEPMPNADSALYMSCFPPDEQKRSKDAKFPGEILKIVDLREQLQQSFFAKKNYTKSPLPSPLLSIGKKIVESQDYFSFIPGQCGKAKRAALMTAAIATVNSVSTTEQQDILLDAFYAVNSFAYMHQSNSGLQRYELQGNTDEGSKSASQIRRSIRLMAKESTSGLMHYFSKWCSAKVSRLQSSKQDPEDGTWQNRKTIEDAAEKELLKYIAEKYQAEFNEKFSQPQARNKR